MNLPDPPPAALKDDSPDVLVASAVRALPAGAALGEFEVGEIIGEGTATIVYAASDRARGVAVAIAEFMPASTQSCRKTEFKTTRAAGERPNDIFDTPRMTFASGISARICFIASIV
jgi:hypothetical protein